ncbi:hypothetical protein C5S35_00585 [Candidatus Methanophagaceae archaeon]|nr:hypothetical protein C5S35_00585 [Methanophagales archaeon]
MSEMEKTRMGDREEKGDKVTEMYKELKGKIEPLYDSIRLRKNY